MIRFTIISKIYLVLYKTLMIIKNSNNQSIIIISKNYANSFKLQILVYKFMLYIRVYIYN